MRPSKQSRRVAHAKRNWRTDEYLGFKPELIEWARLAAYIDGEGSINLSPRRTNSGNSQTFCGKVVITGTDVRLANWCAAVFGMKAYAQSFAYGGSRAKNWKSCFHTQACGFKAAWILHNTLPYFLLKREQAEVVLAHQETTNPDMFVRGCGIKTPQNVLDIRLELKRKLAELNRRGVKVEPLADYTKKVMEA